MSENEGYIEQVASLLGLGKRAEAGSEAKRLAARRNLVETAAQESDPRAAALKSDRDAFNKNIRAFSVDRDSSEPLVASKVHLINLDKIRERLGKKWPRFSDRIHSQIKAELKNRLTEHDYFTQVNGDSYAIVFGNCSEVEARLKIAIFSEQILEKLFGEAEAKELGLLGVESVVTRSDGSTSSQALESVDALVGMLDQAEVTELGASCRKYSAAARGDRALTPSEIAELLGEVEEHLEENERECKDGGAPEAKVDRLRSLMRQLESLEDVIAAEGQPEGPQAQHKANYDPCAWVEFRQPFREAIGRLIARAEKQITFASSRSPDDTPEWAEDDDTVDVSFKYLPMWHAPSQRVGIYLCQADVNVPAIRSTEDISEIREYEADFYAVVDRLTLRRARSDLQQSVKDGHVHIIAVPVHFSTLQRHRSREQFVEICSNIPEELRKFLIWEILGAHIDSWSLQLDGALTPIRGFGRTAFLRLQDVQENYQQIRRSLKYLRPAGVQQVGIDISRLEGQEAAQLQLLERLIVDTKSDRLTCYGHGFQSLSMTICVACLGFQHVSGSAISAPCDRPEGIKPTAMESIYASIVAAE